MEQSRWSRGDVVSGVVLAGLGIFIILEARKWEYTGFDGPGPGFFPVWYGVVMVVLSLFLIVSAWLAATAGDWGGRVNWREVGRALFVWVALCVSIALLSVLGFLVSYALLTTFVAAVLYQRPILKAVAAGVGSAVIFYLVFPLALEVSLPVGIFGF